MGETFPNKWFPEELFSWPGWITGNWWIREKGMAERNATFPVIPWTDNLLWTNNEITQIYTWKFPYSNFTLNSTRLGNFRPVTKNHLLWKVFTQRLSSSLKIDWPNYTLPRLLELKVKAIDYIIYDITLISFIIQRQLLPDDAQIISTLRYWGTGALWYLGYIGFFHIHKHFAFSPVKGI